MDMHRRRLRKIGIRLGPGSIGVVGEVVRSGCRTEATTSFGCRVARPLESIVETIFPSRVPKTQPGEKIAPQSPVGDVRERLGAICGGGIPAATPLDACRILLLARRVLHEAKMRNVGSPAVRRLNAVVGRARHLFLARCRANGGHSGSSGAGGILQMTVRELLGGIKDATIQILDAPKGSGVRVARYAMVAGGGGDDPGPPKKTRGPGRGGLTIHNSFVNDLYHVHPNREVIEFRPYVGEKGKEYRINIRQKAAWEIVNRLTGKVKPGNRDDWYVKFTGRDANVMRSANAEFLKDCIERERCLPQEQKGNRKWSGRARLRNAPKPSKK